MRHSEYDYVLQAVKAELNPLLEGEAGTGKTTIAQQVAKDLGLQFSSISLTKQTSVGALLGFMSAAEGVYITTLFRQAYEHGHLFLLDELDAADSNVLLCLNTMENGFIAFPDKIVHQHENFRLIATANPQNEHSIYTGRSKLDFSTLDRFFTIAINRDSALEQELTSKETYELVTAGRKILKTNGEPFPITMRDAIRIDKLAKLGIDKNPIDRVVLNKDPSIKRIFWEEYEEMKQKLEQERIEREKEEAEAKKTQHDVDNLQDLITKINEGK